MVKNILITGGAGYIGSHVTEILLKKYKKVAFLSKNKSSLFTQNIKFAIDQLGADLNIRQKIAKDNTYKIRTIKMIKKIEFLN